MIVTSLLVWDITWFIGGVLFFVYRMFRDRCKWFELNAAHLAAFGLVLVINMLLTVFTVATVDMINRQQQAEELHQLQIQRLQGE